MKIEKEGKRITISELEDSYNTIYIVNVSPGRELGKILKNIENE